MTMRRYALAALATLAALALTAAACSDDDGDDDAAAPTTTEAPASETTATTTEDATVAPIELTDSSLGSILTSNGRTLYAFVPDAGGGASTCTGTCADTWPALQAGEVTVGAGLDPSLFTTTLSDQVVIDGWPLYFFANDANPGDTNGQGIGGNWYVVGADGAMIQG